MPDPTDHVKRYHAAAHAMQTGVAYRMQYDPTTTEPKHLRVGVNSAQVSAAALAALLIDKGLITLAEYEKSLADHMETEAESYRAWLADRLHTNITLG